MESAEQKFPLSQILEHADFSVKIICTAFKEMPEGENKKSISNEIRKLLTDIDKIILQFAMYK